MYNNLVEVMACSFAFVFVLYSVVEKKKAIKIGSNSMHEKIIGQEIGICSLKEVARGIDIIIVGAGVVGAALAYTLGMVKLN